MKFTKSLSIIASLLASSAFAIEPEDLDGRAFTAGDYAGLVAEAMASTPPKNGDSYVFGFANLGRNAPFFMLVENSILENAEAAGIEVLVTDNAFDGQTALANAESYLRRNVDYVIEFQTDANFGPTIMQKFEADGIRVTAIDIPMPGATFMGANNSRSGFMGGLYLGQAARAKWGDEAVAQGYLVVGELPQSGAIPMMRTEGQIAGFFAEHPGLPANHVVRIDTKGTLEGGFSIMSDAVGRIPEGAPIMGVAINDQSILGMMRAVEQAGRSADAIFVGMGADEGATMSESPNFLASVGYFPENYGNYLVPLALMELAGKDTPPAALVSHVMVTSGTVCEFYPDVPCAEGEQIDYSFNDEAFAAHVDEQRAKPELADYQALIQAD